MRGFFIFIIMLIGFVLVVKTAMEFLQHKRYMFKNISIMKKQRLSFLIGVIGAIILLITVIIIWK